MTLNEANKLWYNSLPIKGILFGYNDYVYIISGKYVGEYGSVISLNSFEPVTYLVEINSGKDVIVVETELRKRE